MKMQKDYKEEILSLIPKNKESAITVLEICKILKISHRTVKENIHKLRKNHPICSKDTDGGGYWIAESEKDLIEFINLITKRRNSYNETIGNMAKHIIG